MRTILLSACLSFLSIMLFAQVPQAIKYQAVARDSAGSIMANANITVRISIIDSAAGGGVAYSEIHNTSTNQFGVFNISIGRGTQQNGLFANIIWVTGSKWIQQEISLNQGVSYTLLGSSELLSVPYALYAETSINVPDSGFFNPLYPDGTVGMTGLTWKVTNSTPYVVPSGKKLHIHKFKSDGHATVTVSGIDFQAGSPLVVGSGDSIKTFSFSPQDFIIHGYLINAKVTPVNVDLSNGAYTVPNGKQLFVNYTHVLSNSKILVNGIGASIEIGARPPLPEIYESGDVISVSPIPAFDSYLNGYLK